MGYCEDERKVRVDFFKESGKWYLTEAIMWIGYSGLIHEEFRESLDRHLEGRMKGMRAVCLAPYNHSPFPLMVTV